MGNCGSSGGSSGATARDKYEAGQKQTAAKLANLGCTRGTVSAVLRLYRQADTNKDGHVDLGEFARQFEIERRNPFLPRLVQLFDLSGDGQMSVFEYVVCLSQFGARRGRGDHIYFAWRLFDVDDDGALTKDEFVRVLKSTYMRGGEQRRGGEKFNTDDRVGRGFSNFGGVGGFAKGIDSIIRDMDTDGDGTIGLKEFTGVMKKYQHFMSPAFDLWQKLEAFAGPCARMYAEVRAAGKLDELIDLAMHSSDTRHGDDDVELRADRADDESLFGGGTSKPKPKPKPRRDVDRVGAGKPRVGKTGAKTEDVGMAVFRRKAAMENQKGRPVRDKYSESEDESEDEGGGRISRSSRAPDSYREDSGMRKQAPAPVRTKKPWQMDDDLESQPPVRNTQPVRRDVYSGGMASMEDDLDAMMERKSSTKLSDDFRRKAKDAETPSPLRRMIKDPKYDGKTTEEIEMEKFMMGGDSDSDLSDYGLAPPPRARAQPVPGLNIRSSGQPVNVVQRDTRTDAERRAALRNDYERATGGGGGGEGGGGGRLNERGGGATRMGARGRNAPRQAHAPRDW